MRKLKIPSRLNSQIRAEATEWLIRFSEEEEGTAAREEFNRWLRASPEHVRAYLRISAFWQEAGRIAGGTDRRDIDALVRLAQREANVFPLDPALESEARGRVKRVREGLPLALAAGVLLVIGAVAVWDISGHAPSYVTGIGEQRTVNLSDGSTVVINAGSRLKVRFGKAERAIELDEGQAFFRVAKDAARPFVVRSGGSSFKAVGTQFDIYKKEKSTVITVTEGRVVILPLTLSPLVREGRGEGLLLKAGEQAVVTPRFARKKSVARPETAIAWTEGLLVFDSAPLKEVVHEFNRQNAKPLILDSPELGDLKISGTFPANGSRRIVRFLEERFHVDVADTKEGTRISGP